VIVAGKPLAAPRSRRQRYRGKMKQLRSLALSSLLSFGLLGSPAWAMVSHRDAQATHAYLQAKLAERRGVLSSVVPGTRAIEALAEQVRGECPNVLAGMPHGEHGEVLEGSTTRIIEEVVLTPFVAYESAAHPALARFDRDVQRLRWSSHKLTKLLHSLALEHDEQSDLREPPLCSDLRFWTASGYTHVSSQTEAFHKEVIRTASIAKIEPETRRLTGRDFANLDGLVASRLKHYEGVADRSLARHALRPERKLSSVRLRSFFTASEAVYEALGLPRASFKEPGD
jgi:hypothetical protein